MKLSDYVFRRIARLGVRHVFFLPGGGAMHLNDSLSRQEGLEPVCNLHEQACAIAAEAYAKTTGSIGVVLVTAGPGGTNAVTGVAGAWLDSTPLLVLSGQVKRADLAGDTGVRQRGVQEIDIVSIVRPITKYSATVLEPASIRHHLDRALDLARRGRPGPVWLDIPLDVQAARVDPDAMPAFEAPAEAPDPGLEDDVRRTLDLLEASDRPVLLVGNGVRLAGAASDLEEAIELLDVPVLLTWLAIDLLPEAEPRLVGRPGAVAPRGPNFALQCSDFLLAVGARLDLVVTGYAPDRLAVGARKVVVDVDPAELRKPGLSADLAVRADARDFLRELVRQARGRSRRDRLEWWRRCRDWKTRYPVVLPEHRERTGLVSVYALSDVLSDELGAADVVVSGSSGAGIEIFLLAFRVPRGVRVLHTTALGAMGFGPPAAIGACLARDRCRTVVVDGDGGFLLNVQELETIARLRLPVKLFVLNNGGFSSIRTMQRAHFGLVSSADASSGLTLPDVSSVAAAFGLPSSVIQGQPGLRERVREVLECDGPVVCDVRVVPDEDRLPRITSRALPDGSMTSTPLEDLYPFLPREELARNLGVAPDAERRGGE